jgi:DNA-binding NarL/FixJ family response regulator
VRKRKKQPTFSLEQEGPQWYLVTRTPIFMQPESFTISLPTLDRLSIFNRRETEVLAMVMEGKANKEISSELGISVPTVKFHVSNLLRKSGCTDRMELVSRQYSRMEKHDCMQHS